MNKNKNKKKNNIITYRVVLCTLLAALLIPAMFISSRTINRELISYIKQTLNEISQQNVNSIQCKVKDDFLLLGEISDRVRFDGSADSIATGMQTASDFYGYKRMGVLYRDGKMYDSDGVQLDIMDQEHIVRAFAGENVLSDLQIDQADGKPILIFVVPVYDMAEEEVIAVLFASCDTANFSDHLSVSAFDGREYTYIVKTDGTAVINSLHKSAYTDMKNVFDAMESVGDNGDVARRMREEMAAGKSNCLLFSNNGDQRYINYEPLGINDWYILSVVSADVMDGSRFKIMMVVYTVFAVMAAAALILVVSIVKGEKVKQTELERVLYSDELTGGITFNKFCADAPELLEKKMDKSVKAACVMADLENFRLINNLYGKSEGDKTIINSYKAFKKAIGESGLLARLTADKFYALIFFKEHEELERILKSFKEELKASGGTTENEYVLTPSVGVYIVTKPSEDIENITNNATIAHDTIKKTPGEKIVFYDEAQRDRLKMNKIMEDKMELAHQNGEFIPYFQPKYDVKTGKICGAEALVRWRNADGSVTMPGKFIPLAESNGFIRVLDRDVFNAVCAFQQNQMESGGMCVPISVNVSRQLMYEQNFAEDYIETIRKYNLSPDLVELEITESVLFDDYDVFGSIIGTLRENGFKILMDDFGTGYSSLMMLGSVPIDNLKLDKSFIDSFEEEKGRKIIVCVIELAKSLSLSLTAEGVETRGQYDFLKSMGCNVIQGYYFSKPVPAETFREMLAAGTI